MSYTIPSEAQEAHALVGFLRKFRLKFAHVPNETGIWGNLGFRIALKKKREGMQSGFPDYLIFFRDKMIAIELKKRRKILLNGKFGASPSKVTDEQREWVADLSKLPYCEAFICYGADEAIGIITEYMKWHKRENEQE